MNSSSHRHWALISICLVTLVLLACRLETFAGVATTATPARTRAALRPTFTPVPPDTETPIPTDTEVPTEAPTAEPPTDTPEPEPTAVPATRAPRPTATPLPPPTAAPSDTPQPTATIDFPFKAGQASCGPVDNATTDVVKGTINAGGKAAVGQRVRGSAGPGGEPIAYPDTLSDSNGKYTVTFACGSSACNGDFWVWMVNAEGQQTSPFVKFHFDDNCRKGKIDFTKG